MTANEMYLLFSDLMDKARRETDAEIYPEQVFNYINIAINELELAAREQFEQTSKLSDDIAPLVKKGHITPTNDFFSYNSVVDDNSSPMIINYFIQGYLFTKYKDKLGITELTRVQQDDVRPATNDPFLNNTYADKVLFYIEDNGLRVESKPSLELIKLTGRFLITHPTVSDTQDCIFPKQLHVSIVKRAVELALEIIESQRVATFDKN